jgi:Cupin
MDGLLGSAEGLGSETPEPSYGLAPPALDAAELPSFRYPLGGIKAETFAGALRELHWQANAAEWAYVIEGRCRVTTIDPENQAQIADFGVGDGGFPRGHGHSIQGLGPGACTFILVFDNGYFSESAPSRPPTGSATRGPRHSPRISTFPLRPSPTSRRKKFISPRAPCRRLPAAPCASSRCASFPSRRR